MKSTKRRHAGKKNCRLYDLPRKECEARINDYNPRLMLCWRANMDIQFIGENSNTVIRYILGYITKKESADLDKI
jgi:hypothetical protein